jgi:hypothetical protein
MTLLSTSANIESPIQQHQVCLANDVQWITGGLRSLGNPHNYINQDDQDTFNLLEANVYPWSFTGLPTSRTPQTIVMKRQVQLLLFPNPETKEGFRAPIRTSKIMLHLPLAIIRGDAPFMSEASIENFLDFWKPTFFPMMNVNIHYLVDCAVHLPTEIVILYINRESVLSYFSA